MNDQLEASLRSCTEFLADLTWDRLPAGARHSARRIFVDEVGAGLAGSTEPELAALRAEWAGPAGPGEVTLLAPGLERVDVLRALVHNGTAISKSELCGGYRHTPAHAGMYTLPTALALGEVHRTSGKRLLSAMVAGYEAAARCAIAFKLPRHIHLHGPWGMVGASITAAHLRGADREGMYQAFTVALALLPASAWQLSSGGGTARTTRLGVNALVSAFVPEFVAAHFDTCLEGITQQLRGLLQTGWDLAALEKPPHHPDYALTHNYHKRYACVGYVFPVLEAVEQAFPDLPVPAGLIESVTLDVPEAAAERSVDEPEGDVAARFSIPYCIAQLLLTGRVDPENFTAAALADPATRAFMGKLKVVGDPALPSPWSSQRVARVTARLSDGSVRSAFCENARGDYTNPFTDEELSQKFLRVTRPALGARGEEVLRRLWEIDAAGDVRTLMDAVAGRPATGR